MARINLVYATDESNEVEIPFRLLVLGNFSLSPSTTHLYNLKPISIDSKNFNRIMEKLKITLKLGVKNHLIKDTKHDLFVTISIRCLEDFSPDKLVDAIPEMKQLIELKTQLSSLKKSSRKTEEILEYDSIGNKLLISLGYPDKNVPRDIVDAVISDINERLTRQLDEVIHHNDFKSLESAWRGLYFLICQLKPSENCAVDILNLSKEQLSSDFHEWGDISETLLYKIIYTESFGQFGGKPYGAVLGNYLFDFSQKDIDLLKNITQVACISHVPFITSVHAPFFGIKDYSGLLSIDDISEQFRRGIQYTRWKSFRKSEGARYVGLTLPGFLLRTSYNYDIDNIRSFDYRESQHNLWGNAVFAFGTCLLRSFVNYRWCLNLLGPDDGRIHGLKWSTHNALGKNEKIMPLEILISERKESELSDAGFIPLAMHRGDGFAAFYSANSAYSIDTHNLPNKQALIDESLAAQLPYTFIICRLAHYIKVIQRDNIGSSKSRQQLESELNQWLIQYVSDMDNPVPEVKAQRPLRKAFVKVTKLHEMKNWYIMQLNVIPHLKYMGAAFTLSLQGRLGD